MSTSITVADVMDANPMVVPETSSLELARKLLNCTGERVLWIESESGQLQGVITRSDLLRSSLSQIARSEGSNADEWVPVGLSMTRGPSTIRENHPLAFAIEKMLQEGISSLAVVRSGKIVGQLTKQRLTLLATSLLEAEKAQDKAEAENNFAELYFLDRPRNETPSVMAGA